MSAIIPTLNDTKINIQLVAAESGWHVLHFCDDGNIFDVNDISVTKNPIIAWRIVTTRPIYYPADEPEPDSENLVSYGMPVTCDSTDVDQFYVISSPTGDLFTPFGSVFDSILEAKQTYCLSELSRQRRK